MVPVQNLEGSDPWFLPELAVRWRNRTYVAEEILKTYGPLTKPATKFIQPIEYFSILRNNLSAWLHFSGLKNNDPCIAPGISTYSLFDLFSCHSAFILRIKTISLSPLVINTDYSTGFSIPCRIPFPVPSRSCRNRCLPKSRKTPSNIFLHIIIDVHASSHIPDHLYKESPGNDPDHQGVKGKPTTSSPRF
jgi:hypothetical protein